MKTVIYLGKEYEVPDDARYMATDQSGHIFAYTERPREMSISWNASGAHYYIGHVNGMRYTWKNTCRNF